jgi:SH3 domain-containing YSC84-like protein 1
MQLPLTRAAVLALMFSIIAAASAVASISTAEKNRLNEASAIVADLRANVEKGIPDDIWSKAECVVVIPDMKKAAFIFGGEYGRGVMSCRNGNVWSAPVFMQLAKGSWGFQAGAEEIDLVLLVMNRGGAEKLLSNNVSLGVDASVAAGPVGRAASASTDAALKAEILAYSRAHGLFAGVNISGGALKPDQDANKDAYGTADIKSVVFNKAVPPPAEASDFLRTLSTNVRATSGTADPPATDRRK